MGTIGIEWVNKYHGRASELKNNDNNARGFYNELSGTRQFEYGDDSAWDQDFEQSGTGAPTAGSDTIYADNVDIIFFSGHGNSGGGMFGVDTFDDGWARSSNMRLGDLQAEWIIFDACEVMKESTRLNWQQVFQGLHYILGFHTTCSDKSNRGKKFAEYLNDGHSVRWSWIKACIETQGSGTWCAYYRAEESGVSDTYNDHWHGKGFVSNDPDNPTSFTYFRQTC